MRMRLFARIIASVCLMAASRATCDIRADESLPPPPPPARQTTTAHRTIPIMSPGEVTATPEMWFYEQALQRYDDPKYAIRAAAEQRAAQRRARIAAMEWYGYSNSRPLWGIDPVHGYIESAVGRQRLRSVHLGGALVHVGDLEYSRRRIGFLNWPSTKVGRGFGGG